MKTLKKPYINVVFSESAHLSFPSPHPSQQETQRQYFLKLLWSPGIDSKESIPPAYVAWQAYEYDNPIPTRFLARIVVQKFQSRILFSTEKKKERYTGTS